MFYASADLKWPILNLSRHKVEVHSTSCSILPDRDKGALIGPQSQAAFVAIPFGGDMTCFVLLLVNPGELPTPRVQIPSDWGCCTQPCKKQQEVCIWITFSHSECVGLVMY